MDVMKAVKNVLSWAFVFALIAMIFSAPQVKADGVHGVRETAKEIFVEVPLSCNKSVEFVWEAKWKWTADNEDTVFAFPQKDKGQKIVVQYIRPGAFKFHAPWRGGETVRSPKFDAKGNPIKMEFLSILALGG